jgi:hypothetical protein
MINDKLKFSLHFIQAVPKLSPINGTQQFPRSILTRNRNQIFKVKFAIFSKKLLCKVPIFFIHRLGSRKRRKKWVLSFKKIGDDIIAQKTSDVI